MICKKCNQDDRYKDGRCRSCAKIYSRARYVPVSEGERKKPGRKPLPVGDLKLDDRQAFTLRLPPGQGSG